MEAGGNVGLRGFLFILLFLICLYFRVGDANVSCVIGHDPRERKNRMMM